LDLVGNFKRMLRPRAPSLDGVRRLFKWKRGEKSPPSFVLPPYEAAATSGRYRTFRIGIALALIAFCFVYGFFYAIVTPYLLVAFVFPIALMGVIAIWALPDMAHPPTRELRWLFMAFMMAIPLWPNYLAVAIPGLPWLTLTRLIGVPMTLIFLICLSVSSDFRRVIKTVLTDAGLIWKFLVLFAIIQIFSIAFSPAKGASMQPLIIFEMNWVGAFFIGCFVFSKKDDTLTWAALVCIAALLLSGMAAVEFVEGHPAWVGHIPKFLKVEDPLIYASLFGSTREGHHRVQGTYTESLGLAEYMGLAMPFLIYFAVGQFPRYARWAAVLTMPAVLFATIETQARLGLIGLIMAAVLYIFFWAALRWLKNRHDLFAAIAFFSFPAAAGSLFGASFFVSFLHNKLWGGGDQQASTQARIDQYRTGIPKLLNHPFGHGVNQGAIDLGYFLPSGQLTIDTYYLDIALDYGFLGVLFYYGFFILSIYKSSLYVMKAKTLSKEEALLIPTTISLIIFLIIKAVYSQQENHPIAFILAGLIIGITGRPHLAIANPAAARKTVGAQLRLKDRGAALLPET
jgi:hypothetical protein